MKYLFLLLFLAGCASGPTEYYQGCVDGYRLHTNGMPAGSDQLECDALEYEHNKKLRYDYINHRERP